MYFTNIHNDGSFKGGVCWKDEEQWFGLLFLRMGEQIENDFWDYSTFTKCEILTLFIVMTPDKLIFI